MSDRELLEAAAKAAGYELTWGETYKVGEDKIDCTDLPYVVGGSPDVGPVYWNPLEDDGDALRLAVKLGIGVEWWSAMPNSMAGRVNFDGNGVIMMANVHDRAAMLRRAIVRAAASIGSGKESAS